MKQESIKRYFVFSIIFTIIISLISFFVILKLWENNKISIMQNYATNSLVNNFALTEIENNSFKYIIISFVVLFIICLFLISYFTYILSKTKKEVKSVREYVEDLLNKNYKLELNNISESEISNLKNDLYKIITDLKEMAENLSKDRETLSNYLAYISHQLRTPLMAISSMVDAIIANESKLDNDTRKFIFAASKQLDQMNWLVNSLLQMAQLDTKSVNFNMKDCNLKDILYMVRDNLNIFLEIKNLNLIIEDNTNTQIYIDEKWFVEAVENIIKNCIEHSYNNSNIIIKCEKNPLFIKLLIKDNGVGIEEEDKNKIFDKFFRGKNSDDNSYGIGLSLAKTIIENQNGEISVESSINQGTSFIIKIYNI